MLQKDKIWLPISDSSHSSMKYRNKLNTLLRTAPKVHEYVLIEQTTKQIVANRFPPTKILLVEQTYELPISYPSESQGSNPIKVLLGKINFKRAGIGLATSLLTGLSIF